MLGDEEAPDDRDDGADRGRAQTPGPAADQHPERSQPTDGREDHQRQPGTREAVIDEARV